MALCFEMLVWLLVLADPNTVGYMYTWHETSIAPTQEIQESLAIQQWEDDYVPWWYQLRYPGVAPNMWFRWERTLLPTAVAWLTNPSDLNHDRKVDFHDYGIMADFHPGGLKSKPPPPIPPPSAPRKPRITIAEVAMFAEMLFMTETDR